MVARDASIFLLKPFMERNEVPGTGTVHYYPFGRYRYWVCCSSPFSRGMQKLVILTYRTVKRLKYSQINHPAKTQNLKIHFDEDTKLSIVKKCLVLPVLLYLLNLHVYTCSC